MSLYKNPFIWCLCNFSIGMECTVRKRIFTGSNKNKEPLDTNIGLEYNQRVK